MSVPPLPPPRLESLKAAVEEARTTCNGHSPEADPLVNGNEGSCLVVVSRKRKLSSDSQQQQPQMQMQPPPQTQQQAQQPHQHSPPPNFRRKLKQ
jgi:hypothetical protein